MPEAYHGNFVSKELTKTIMCSNLNCVANILKAAW